MSRANTADGDVDELGVLLAAALGLDRGWTKRAACRGWRYDDDPDGAMMRPSPWHLAPGDVDPANRERTAYEMVKVALMICHGCPVQWDCARYAIEGQMRAGTWAMPISVLRSMSRPANIERSLAQIDAAEAEGFPVQVAVGTPTQAR